MSLKVLQFGTTGQVGIELSRQAADHDVALTALSRAEADFADPAACTAKVRELKPELVVIAAAYTAVDQAESDRETAFRVNAETPAAIAAACAEVGAALVLISTDYVFPGDGTRPYREDDATGPVSVYGASKLAGEQAVLAASPRTTILRTSWVVSAHGKNFVKTMLRLAAGGALRVVDDQRGCPTSAADIAGFVLSQAGRLAAAQAGDEVFGVFHFANVGETTWRRFAEAIVAEAMGAQAPAVAPISTADFPTPAKRPAYSVLDTGKLTRVFGVTPRPWSAALSEIIAELKVAA